MNHIIEIKKSTIFKRAKYWVTCSCGWFHGARTQKHADVISNDHLTVLSSQKIQSI